VSISLTLTPHPSSSKLPPLPLPFGVRGGVRQLGVASPAQI